MKPVLMIAAVAVAAAGLTACGSKDKPAADPTPTSLHTRRTAPSPDSGSASPQKTPSPSSSPKGATNTIDPCQLVTRDEASTLANASFGPGQAGGNNIRHECIYGAQTPNVLSVYVLQGASSDDAQSEWDLLLAQAQQGAGQAANLLTLTPDSTVGDRAEWVELSLSQVAISARGLAFLKGAVGVYIIDLVRGGAAPSRDALSVQAQTVLDRLPS